MRRLPHDLVGQFVLCQSEGPIPEGWLVRRSGGWLLASHPRLPILEIAGSGASHLGWLIGYPVHPSGRLLTSRFEITGQQSRTLGPAQFEEHLYALGGRFAAVFLGAACSRVYLDPCGSLAVVYCPEQGVVASSPNLIPPSAGTPEDRDLVRAVGVVERARWYPFGLTPRRGVERLLPNHALDLQTWHPVRHWPTNGSLAPTPDIAGAVDEIAAIVETAIGAVVRAHPLAMPLTAGRHTRMQLACARGYLSDTVVFTIPLPDELGALDCAVARRIARRFHLNYVPLTWAEAAPNELDAWLYRTGTCVAGRTWKTAATLHQLDPRRCILSAILGDLAGPPPWRNRDIDPSRATPLDLVTNFRVDPTPVLIDRARQWLEAVPARGSVTVLDFLRLEQRYGCSFGPQEYGPTNPAFQLSPFCHRRVVELMLSLPPDYRNHDQLPRDLISSRWPELLRFPFNQAVGPGAIIPATRRALRSMVRMLLP
jgi:hypothetical protein